MTHLGPSTSGRILSNKRGKFSVRKSSGEKREDILDLGQLLDYWEFGIILSLENSAKLHNVRNTYWLIGWKQKRHFSIQNIFFNCSDRIMISWNWRHLGTYFGIWHLQQADIGNLVSTASYWNLLTLGLQMFLASMVIITELQHKTIPCKMEKTTGW